jgi:hypothetical protein
MSDILVAKSGENYAACIFSDPMDAGLAIILWGEDPNEWKVKALTPDNVVEVLGRHEWVTLSPPMRRGEIFKVIQVQPFLDYLFRASLERENTYD